MDVLISLCSHFSFLFFICYTDLSGLFCSSGIPSLPCCNYSQTRSFCSATVCCLSGFHYPWLNCGFYCLFDVTSSISQNLGIVLGQRTVNSKMIFRISASGLISSLGSTLQLFWHRSPNRAFVFIGLLTVESLILVLNLFLSLFWLCSLLLFWSLFKCPSSELSHFVLQPLVQFLLSLITGSAKLPLPSSIQLSLWPSHHNAT